MPNCLTVAVDSHGNIVISGPIHPDPSRWAEVFVAQFDCRGHMLWQRSLNRTGAAGDSYAVAPAPPAAPPAMPFESSNAVPNASSNRTPPYRVGLYATQPLTDRDSAPPLALDSTLSIPPPTRGQRSRARWAAVASVGAACTFSAGMVGAAVVTQRQVAASEMAAAVVTGLPLSAMVRNVAQRALNAVPHAAVTVRPVAMTIEAPSIEALRKTTVSLMVAGKRKQALEAARRYVHAAPKDAFSHLCLGAALQDLGRMKEARSAFRACVRQAETGDIQECRSFAG